MLNYDQFEKLILIPALTGIGLDVFEMRLLVAGTIAHESKGGTYLKQIQGPALGIGQMEPSTHDSIWQSYLPNQTFLTSRLIATCQFSRAPKSDMLVRDLLYATCMVAILYKWRMDSHKVDMPKSLDEAAVIWKRFYNTEKGKGKPEDFINDYHQWTGRDRAIKPRKISA